VGCSTWPEERVAVEADGWEAHGTPWASQADREQSSALQVAGYVVLRFTHADNGARGPRQAVPHTLTACPSSRSGATP
jgi:very-short-patch-repair endonuclease